MSELQSSSHDKHTRLQHISRVPGPAHCCVSKPMQWEKQGMMGTVLAMAGSLFHILWGRVQNLSWRKTTLVWENILRGFLVTQINNPESSLVAEVEKMGNAITS